MFDSVEKVFAAAGDLMQAQFDVFGKGLHLENLVASFEKATGVKPVFEVNMFVMTSIVFVALFAVFMAAETYADKNGLQDLVRPIDNAAFLALVTASMLMVTSPLVASMGAFFAFLTGFAVVMVAFGMLIVSYTAIVGVIAAAVVVVQAARRARIAAPASSRFSE